jgi:hypothetical protein
MKMPVTTKAQLGAENEDCATNVKPRMREFLCKTKEFAKTRDIPERSLSPTCGALHLKSKRGHL